VTDDYYKEKVYLLPVVCYLYCATCTVRRSLLADEGSRRRVSETLQVTIVKGGYVQKKVGSSHLQDESARRIGSKCTCK
jgi:hypothetical protein